MKVILLTDIPKVGNRYDVKEFKDGYAINVLISKGLAEMATPHALGKLASKKAEMDKKRKEEVLPPGETKAKDITPVEEPTQTSLRDVITAYNSADLTTQIDFIKLLVKHDLEKIHYALKGTK